MSVAIAIVAALWGATILSRPARIPQAAEEVQWLVYIRLYSRWDSLRIAAIVATLLLVIYIIIFIYRGVDTDLYRLRNRCNDWACWTLNSHNEWVSEPSGR